MKPGLQVCVKAEGEDGSVSFCVTTIIKGKTLSFRAVAVVFTYCKTTNTN